MSYPAFQESGRGFAAIWHHHERAFRNRQSVDVYETQGRSVSDFWSKCRCHSCAVHPSSRNRILSSTAKDSGIIYTEWPVLRVGLFTAQIILYAHVSRCQVTVKCPLHRNGRSAEKELLTIARPKQVVLVSDGASITLQ